MPVGQRLLPPHVGDSLWVTEASYIVYQQTVDGETVFYTKNGMTGQVQFSGTDASAGIQAAIDAGEGRVVIKQGIYDIVTSINMVSNTWLEGGGKQRTILRLAANINIFTFNGTKYSGISQMGLTGGVYGTYTGSGVYLTGAAGATYLRDILFDFFTPHAIYGDNAYSVFIRDSTFRFNGIAGSSAAVNFVGSAGSMLTNILIDRCVFEPNYYSDISAKNYIDGLIIQNSWFEGEDIAGVKEPSFYHITINAITMFSIKHVRILNNRFYDPASSSCGMMSIGGVPRFTIQGNYGDSGISNTCTSIMLFSNLSYGTIANNYIHYQAAPAAGASGIYFTAPGRNVLISNNYVAGVDCHGIRLVDAVKCTVIENDIDYAGQYGIFVTGTTAGYVTIIGNHIVSGWAEIVVNNNLTHALIMGNEAASITVTNPSIHKLVENYDYIGSGEERTVYGTLTAGVANAICFSWNNPHLQDILIKKVIIEVTTGGGTVGSHLDVGIADDAAGTNRGTEFFNDLLLNNVQINDSWVAGDGGTQTKWVFCQDIASAVDDWVVGQILDANAASLVGKYYIVYAGR